MNVAVLPSPFSVTDTAVSLTVKLAMSASVVVTDTCSEIPSKSSSDCASSTVSVMIDV